MSDRRPNPQHHSLPVAAPFLCSAIPFAGIADYLLPLLEQRTMSGAFCCKKCRHAYSVPLASRTTNPTGWSDCPNCNPAPS